MSGAVLPKKVRRATPQPYHHGDLRRALIDTALELVTEEQDWAFSLREVARRAGVSHQAPYNHFPEKQDLLAAVAIVGFERLRDGMLRAMAEIDAPEALIAVIGRTYVRLGLRKPCALPADVRSGDRRRRSEGPPNGCQIGWRPGQSGVGRGH